jgi:hypothetical protein
MGEPLIVSGMACLVETETVLRTLPWSPATVPIHGFRRLWFSSSPQLARGAKSREEKNGHVLGGTKEATLHKQIRTGTQSYEYSYSGFAETSEGAQPNGFRQGVDERLQCPALPRVPVREYLYILQAWMMGLPMPCPSEI